MVSRHWPTYLAIASLVVVALACLTALTDGPAERLTTTDAPAAQSQVNTGPAAPNAHDPFEAVDMPTGRTLPSGVR